MLVFSFFAGCCCNNCVSDFLKRSGSTCSLGGTIKNVRAGGFRRTYQRSEKSEASDEIGMLSGNVLTDDRAHRMANEVSRGDAEVTAYTDHGVHHDADIELAGEVARAPTTREVDPDDTVALHRWKQRRPCVAGSAQTVYAHDCVAFAFDFNCQVFNNLSCHLFLAN
jgi:hypothetical protein